MTTGETALLVSFYLLFFVGGLVLFVWYGLKFSDETYEPRYQPRTYRTSATYFFLSTDLVMAIFLSALGLYLTYFFSTPFSNKSGSPDWTIYALVGLLIVLSFATAAYIFILYANYWNYTKDCVLDFDPEARTLTVQTDADDYVIGEGTIKKVDVFSNENYRLMYSYYLFKFQDGRELIVPDKTKGIHAIFDFFKDLPMHRHKRWMPTIQ